ncbi:MAG: hypothetical protein ACM3Y8_07235, partial [Byssovorax cruenta]
MATSAVTIDPLPEAGTADVLDASSLRVELPQPARKFYRHGWQSWTLTTWLDPSAPPLPVRAAEFRAKDEDPGFAFHKNHISCWVGAVELAEEDILLLGALTLGGRVELDGNTLHGFYETVGTENNASPGWLLARG